jgi:hypothetical protein
VLRLSSILDWLGSVGALLAAVAAPCCFPLFAALGTATGLTALAPYEGIILDIFQGFALLALAGLAISFRKHRSPAPLLVGTAACASLAYYFYGRFSLPLLYSGLFGLITASVWNQLLIRATRAPVLDSTITCPRCGKRTEQTMPTNACLYFFDCPACHTRLKPRAGDCCVFCSYGSVPCPPIQAGANCCA